MSVNLGAFDFLIILGIFAVVVTGLIGLVVALVFTFLPRNKGRED
jgi:hypothetical protein